MGRYTSHPSLGVFKAGKRLAKPAFDLAGSERYGYFNPGNEMAGLRPSGSERCPPRGNLVLTDWPGRPTRGWGYISLDIRQVQVQAAELRGEVSFWRWGCYAAITSVLCLHPFGTSPPRCPSISMIHESPAGGLSAHFASAFVSHFWSAHVHGTRHRDEIRRLRPIMQVQVWRILTAVSHLYLQPRSCSDVRRRSVCNAMKG